MKWRSQSLGFSAVLALFGAVFFVPSSGRAAVQWPDKVVVSSPASGTSVYMVALGMGRVVEKHTPIKHWIVQPLGGPAVWAPMMRDGSTQFALHSGPDTLNVLFGRGQYRSLGAMKFIRTVLPGHEYAFMFHTVPGRGIKSLADLKGKVVYTKLPGNPMFQAMLDAQLASAGLTEKDLKASLTMPNVREGARDLIEGRVDAFLYPVVPSAVMQINQAKGECLFVNLTKEQADFVAKRLPGYYPKIVPANSPQFGNKSEMKYAIAYRTGLYASEKIDPEIVYGVTKAILDYHKEWIGSHPQAKYWGPPLSLNMPPYHAGSIRYYKEKGEWTDAAQKNQEELLRELGAAQ